MDLIVSNDRVTPRPNLHSCQSVSVDVVLLQDTTSISEEVHAPLKSSIDLVVF